METLFKKLEYHFLVESAKFENATFPKTVLYQKPMLRQTEWGVQTGPITENEVLLVTTLFFQKLCFSLTHFMPLVSFYTP